jgi:uncharacterized membrane protein
MANFYYYDDNGRKIGPMNNAQLKALAVQGVIVPDTQLEADTGHSGKAGQIKGLFAAAPPQPVSVPPLGNAAPKSNLPLILGITGGSFLLLLLIVAGAVFYAENEAARIRHLELIQEYKREAAEQLLEEENRKAAEQRRKETLELLEEENRKAAEQRRKKALELLEEGNRKAAEQGQDEQKAFLARCPEVVLSKIPADLRALFMSGYEILRPRLDGDDVVMFSNDAEMAAVTGFRVEKGTRTLQIGGQLVTEFRIKKAGPRVHSQICKNYCDGFIPNFLKGAGR